MTLFRTGPLAGGQILIDGVDTKTLGLQVLRNGLSMIPQDALLFVRPLYQRIYPTFFVLTGAAGRHTEV